MFNHIENEYRKEGNKIGIEVVRVLVNNFGEIQFPPQKTQESLDLLDKEWQRQVNKLVKLGFHKELGMTKKAYVESLPKFTSQPESFKRRFDISVIVDPRINWQRQCELAEIRNYISSENIKDWEDDPKGYKTPEFSYIVWMQDGTKNLNKSVKKVRQNLSEDERGATLYDGLSLAIFHPEIMKKHNIDLPGTSVGFDHAPYLFGFSSVLKLTFNWVSNHFSNWGSFSCGR
ncbi:MAG: hypothetical protein ABIJ05_04655 [Patescibacteria group bacterium]